MKALRQDDPRQIGPYAALLRLRETASAVQYLAHGQDGSTVVVAVARPELAGVAAFRRRFAAEARTAERLAGGWVQAPLECRTDGPELWTASGYVPALTLGEAITLAGPLPERTVRILGAALAETLSRVHATGAVLHGLAADTVLLASDGPRLTAFGALGAAAQAAAGPGEQLSVRLGYLTPEQVAGQEPGPASDLFVLGLLLAYAATGATPFSTGPEATAAERIAHDEPELGGVPKELRDLIGRCLAKDPAARPAPGSVAAELALEGAAALARDGWLPDPLVTALAEQASRASAPEDRPSVAAVAVAVHVPVHEPAHEPVHVPAQAQAPARGPAQTPASNQTLSLVRTAEEPTPAPAQLAVPAYLRPERPVLPPALPPAPHPAAAAAGGGGRAVGVDRRSLLTGVVAGAAGLVLGGGGVMAFASDDPAPAPKPAPKPPTPSKRPLPGLYPAPRWAYRHPAQEPPGTPGAMIWRDRVLFVPGGKQTTGVDLRTGRQLWEQPEATAIHLPVAVDDELCLVVTGSEFLWLSAKDGAVGHRVRYAEALVKGDRLRISDVAASDGPVVWFTGLAKGTGKKARERAYLFAYDMVARKELWRAPVPHEHKTNGPRYEAVAVRPEGILVRQNERSLTPGQKKKAKNKAVFMLFDRKSGKRLWSRSVGPIGPDTTVMGAGSSDLLYASVGDDLHAYDTRTGKRKWRLEGERRQTFGEGTLPDGDGADSTLFAANEDHDVYAVNAATGATIWKRSTEGRGSRLPRVALSATGSTALAVGATQVTAFSAQDGARLWKFQDAGVRKPEDGKDRTAPPYRALTARGGLAVVWRDRTYYALEVD
ncbi:PQQ-binding-like beta-propeller repeat protein [Streptomyces sp. 21So2-11]|uniref:outer membrane protein assembly factor BamB family protein n=1 Tax=Streptomyces sp. 21So2-11 TaxID=3144408 RepID=UPI00321A3881